MSTESEKRNFKDQRENFVEVVFSVNIRDLKKKWWWVTAAGAIVWSMESLSMGELGECEKENKAVHMVGGEEH